MPNNSLLFSAPPNWQPHYPGRQHRLPQNALPWLYETGSLTARLRRVYGNGVAVKVLYQCWKPAFVDECRLLGIPKTRYQMIREVLLYVEHQPLVLARSVLPAATINVAQRQLSHLGSRPLGEVIFSYPYLQRRRLEIATIAPDAWLKTIQTEFTITERLWGRRTCYAIDGEPLLVAEVFLPTTLGSRQ